MGVATDSKRSPVSGSRAPFTRRGIEVPTQGKDLSQLFSKKNEGNYTLCTIRGNRRGHPGDAQPSGVDNLLDIAGALC